MSVAAASNSQTSSHSASTHGAPSSRSHSSASHTHPAIGLDRYRASAAPMQRALSPVEQGEAARAADAAAKAATRPTAKSPAATPATPHHPIHVGSTVVTRKDGVRVTTVYVDVKANFRVDGGTLPTGQTAKTQARAIEQAIERDFSRTYRNPDGSVTRYVTDLRMTVGQPDSATRTQLVYVAASDARLGGGVGMAPGFEKGNTAFVGDNGLARTAPHEFGHLAGLRHTAQFNLGCATAPGISISNLMSQSACSTSQQIERSQLQQVFNTPEFR